MMAIRLKFRKWRASKIDAIGLLIADIAKLLSIKVLIFIFIQILILIAIRLIQFNSVAIMFIFQIPFTLWVILNTKELK